MIVVDASAAIRWFKAAVPGGEPFGLPNTEQPLVAPDLFIAEVRNTVLVYLRRNELTLEQAKAMVSTIDRLMAGYFPIEEFRDSAWNLALEYDHSPYDCFYLEVARSIGSYLVTADERLVRKFAGSPYSGNLVRLTDWRP
jgi:predicted nucleic acid-binding protein